MEVEISINCFFKRKCIFQSVHRFKISTLIGPFKGLIGSIRIFLILLSVNFRVIKNMLFFFPNSRGPGGFKELWEACRHHFYLSWHLSNSMVSNLPKHILGETFFPSTVSISPRGTSARPPIGTDRAQLRPSKRFKGIMLKVQ